MILIVEKRKYFFNRYKSQILAHSQIIKKTAFIQL